MSPEHSQSNGMVEKMVGICKRIFAKAKSAGKDPYLGMLKGTMLTKKQQIRIKKRQFLSCFQDR